MECARQDERAAGHTAKASLVLESAHRSILALRVAGAAEVVSHDEPADLTIGGVVRAPLAGEVHVHVRRRAPLDARADIELVSGMSALLWQGCTEPW